MCCSHPGGSWRFREVPGGYVLLSSGRFLEVPGGSWWWFLVVLGGSWWFLVVPGGSASPKSALIGVYYTLNIFFSAGSLATYIYIMYICGL